MRTYGPFAPRGVGHGDIQAEGGHDAPRASVSGLERLLDWAHDDRGSELLPRTAFARRGS
jgi:hypothetical protein